MTEDKLKALNQLDWEIRELKEVIDKAKARKYGVNLSPVFHSELTPFLKQMLQKRIEEFKRL